jgi:hypothetical protein
MLHRMRQAGLQNKSNDGDKEFKLYYLTRLIFFQKKYKVITYRKREYY